MDYAGGSNEFPFVQSQAVTAKWLPWGAEGAEKKRRERRGEISTWMTWKRSSGLDRFLFRVKCIKCIRNVTMYVKLFKMTSSFCETSSTWSRTFVEMPNTVSLQFPKSSYINARNFKFHFSL